MDNNDIVAVRQGTQYAIRRWRAFDGTLLPVPHHDGLYDVGDMLRHLDELRSGGEAWVLDGTIPRLIRGSGRRLGAYSRRLTSIPVQPSPHSR